MLNSIKSNFILKKNFENIEKKFIFRLKNKNNLQTKLGLSIDTYKEYYDEIEIGIIPM